MLFVLVATTASRTAEAEPPDSIKRWLGPQNWVRDTDGPIVSLGEPGSFDDTHIFAPCVYRDEKGFRLLYCGSRGSVAKRVFEIGLTMSHDGRTFTRAAASPVFVFGDGKRSILTPTLLRGLDGSPIREHGKLRMWFSATDFTDKSGLHTLHESTSNDGVRWSEPSPVLLAGVYAPTILKEEQGYRMWYTDVAREPWIIRAATSTDGRKWDIVPNPVLEIDQKWERDRLFYPTVVKADGVYLMWYGSYWLSKDARTALGFAASTDGLTWSKNPHNPVFRPDERRPWE